MRYLLIIILLFEFTTSIFASPKIDSLLHVLDETIADSELYENEKKNRIASIKAEIGTHRMLMAILFRQRVSIGQMWLI